MTLAATASRLLEQFGEPVTLAYETGGDIHPATGEVITPATSVEIAGNGYAGRYTSQDLGGGNIESGDIRLTLEKVSERPQKGWSCTVDGDTYRVMDVRKVRKSAEDVIYICQLRRN